MWIPEDLLSEAFGAFVKNHKRYGSNVPGPLEARKRAAKRRATYLAHPSGATSNSEPFGLYDTSLHGGWWQKAENTPENTNTAWQWPFIFRKVAVGPPPPLPTSATEEGSIRDSSPTYDDLASKRAEERLRKALRNVQDHATLIETLTSLSINLRHSPHLAEIILKEILIGSWDYSEIAEYLLDPRTNSSGTASHVFILENWREHPDLITWLLSQDTLTKAVELGLLDVVDIQRVLLLVPKLETSIFPIGVTWASFCRRLLESMSNSKVLSLEDLGKPFVHRWLQAIPRETFCLSVPELLWGLYKFTGSSNEQALEAVIHSSISMASGNSIQHLHGLIDFLLAQPHEYLRQIVFPLSYRFVKEAGPCTPASEAATGISQRADWSFRRDLLQMVRGLAKDTENSDEILSFDAAADSQFSPLSLPRLGTKGLKIVSEFSGVQDLRQQRLANVSQLELWYAVLANLGSQQWNKFEVGIEDFRAFTNAVWPDVASRRQRSLTAIWVLMTLSVRDKIAINLVPLSKAVIHVLRRDFLGDSKRQIDNILVIVLRALELSPLPAKNKLLWRLSTLSQNFVDVRSSYWELLQLLKDIETDPLDMLRDDNKYFLIRHHFPGKLIRISQCMNSNMSKFEKVCIGVIRDGKDCVNIVQRLLLHNTQLKSALRRTSTSKLSNSEGKERTKASLQNALGGYSHTRLVNMVHNLAQEMAWTECLSPRSALRKVLCIRGFLLMCGVPLTSSMARALWHAGVTRYNRDSLSPGYHQVQWLYGQVATIEGRDVADRLLNNSGCIGLYDLRHEIPANPVCQDKSSGPVAHFGEKPDLDIERMMYAATTNGRIMENFLTNTFEGSPPLPRRDEPPSSSPVSATAHGSACTEVTSCGLPSSLDRASTKKMKRNRNKKVRPLQASEADELGFLESHTPK